MAGDATLAIRITSDASAATRGIDNTTDSVTRLGRESRTAADRIDSVGGRAGKATTGLRDMSDAVAMAGFPQMSAAMGVAAVGLESIDGAATLFSATSGLLGKAIGGVSKALNVMKIAILTNPIFIIAAVLIAIVAVFVLLYMKCEGFRKIVDAVFGFVWNLMKTVWNWIKTAFAAVFDFLSKPFQLWQKIISTVFDKAKDIIGGVVDWIGDTFKKVTDLIIGPFRAAMDWIKSHVKFPSLPSWLPGGSKAAPGAAAYIPAARAGGTSSRTTAGPTIIIQAGIGDPHEIARQIRRILRDDQSRLGRYRPGPAVVA